MTQERKPKFTSLSGLDIARVHSADDLKAWDPKSDLGQPGEFPYTRGVYPTMYRGRLWTMRQFAGFGTAEDTNRRFKYLLQHGQTGLSVAFDLPTLMGLDSDDQRARGEVGYCGVAISSLEDMERLFDGIPLDQVTTSMTINGPAAVVFAMYLAAAERRGIPFERLGGTLQNDILKEYIAQKEWLFPPEPHLRLIVDTVSYGAKHAPKWHPVSISGYHIREAGSTAVQELAFTLYDGLTYVEAAVKAGLNVDAFAPQLSFFFNVHNDFFEEIAKFRAARRLWAREMERRYHPKDPRSLQLRCHAQTAGCSLTAQQPMNNIVRTTLQALAAVLGGTQSLHTNSMDETLALPTEEAVKLALRTQQIIAHESEATNTADPLGGSYYVESLTNRLEEGAREYFRKLDAMGGMVRAIEQGYPQREILEASQRYQREVERKERIIVGVNEYVEPDGQRIPFLKIGPEVERAQVDRLASLRSRRDPFKMAGTLEALQEAAAGDDNLMPYLLEAVKADATLGEICAALKEVFGSYKEPVVL
jgi:methylmalonyl-CoA mutase N-terminal domain/subunit